MVPELGVIEGYFGRPWAHEDRKRVLTQLRQLGYAWFHHAPKADAFLRLAADELAGGGLLIGKVVTRELVVWMLKLVGVRLTTQQAAKFVPIAGQAVSAALQAYALFATSADRGAVRRPTRRAIATPRRPRRSTWRRRSLRPPTCRSDHGRASPHGFMGRDPAPDVSLQAVELPYGRKRALELATTLALDPELMLLDEPTQGMGHEDVDRVMALIKKVSVNRTVLMVEHNMKIVSGICDRITVLARGAVLAEGPYAEIAAHPKVMEAYMGVSADDPLLNGAVA